MLPPPPALPGPPLLPPPALPAAPANRPALASGVTIQLLPPPLAPLLLRLWRRAALPAAAAGMALPGCAWHSGCAYALTVALRPPQLTDPGSCSASITWRTPLAAWLLWCVAAGTLAGTTPAPPTALLLRCWGEVQLEGAPLRGLVAAVAAAAAAAAAAASLPVRSGPMVRLDGTRGLCSRLGSIIIC
jgi:hypothetical protein